MVSRNRVQEKLPSDRIKVTVSQCKNGEKENLTITYTCKT